MNWRVASGLVILLVLSVIVVPLSIECAILVSESNLTPEDYVRMSKTTKVLQWATLFLQIVAGWFLYSGFPTQKVFRANLFRLIGMTLAAVVFSLMCALWTISLASKRWFELAGHFLR